MELLLLTTLEQKNNGKREVAWCYRSDFLPRTAGVPHPLSQHILDAPNELSSHLCQRTEQNWHLQFNNEQFQYRTTRSTHASLICDHVPMFLVTPWSFLFLQWTACSWCRFVQLQQLGWDSFITCFWHLFPFLAYQFSMCSQEYLYLLNDQEVEHQSNVSCC